MDQRNKTVKCMGPGGNIVYMPRQTAESRASRAQGVRIIEDDMVAVPDLGAKATPAKAAEPEVPKPRKPRGPNKAKKVKQPIPAEDAH